MNNHTSRYLIDERPLTVQPTLIKVYGIEQALILQQFYWLLGQPRTGIEHDGQKWIWGTYEEWCADYFTFWEPRTLRYHLDKLKKRGVIVTKQLKKQDWDRTNYYTIDMAKHDALMRQHVATSNGQPIAASEGQHVDASNGQPIAASYKGTEKTSDLSADKTTNKEDHATTTTTRDQPPDSRRGRPAGPEAKVQALPEPAAEPTTPLKLHSLSTTNLSMRTNGQRTRQGDAAYNTICTTIESNGFGMMTPILAGTVNDLMDTYPTDWIVRALQVAVSSNVIRMSYVKGILANWQREGFSDDNRKYNRAAPGHHPPAADNERTQQQRAYNERLTRLMADQVNHAIDEAEAERQWAQLEADFPGFEYEKLP